MFYGIIGSTNLFGALKIVWKMHTSNSNLSYIILLSLFVTFVLNNRIHIHWLIFFLLHRFWLHLNSIMIYCNDNQSRTFISLSIADMPASTQQSLSFIVDKMNSCLGEFKLAPFYQVEFITLRNMATKKICFLRKYCIQMTMNIFYFLRYDHRQYFK